MLKERQLHINRILQKMQENQVEACLISTPVNTFYVFGRIFNGYTYLDADGRLLGLVRRPTDLKARDLNLPEEDFFLIRKPEQIPQFLLDRGLRLPGCLWLEGEEMPQSQWARLSACFAAARILNGSHALRQARSVKTLREQALLRESARRHEAVYRHIPEVYRPGMTQTELAVEVEYLMRKGGCLGLFRTYGNDMEAHMGSLLSGDNAAVSSPYDFALGGAGHPSNPIGADDSPILEGQSVLVDMCGNFNGYLDDLSRCFSVGRLPQAAYRAHQTALEIQAYIQEQLRPGSVCEDIYNGALDIVRRAGLADRFMGKAQQAHFVGHGTGLVINELPVLAPRMKDVLQAGMVLAVEPKIIIDDVGAVGTENTFIVTENGGEKLAGLSDEIVDLTDN